MIVDSELMQKSLVPAVTGAVTAAALLFNVGFFHAVGLDFVPLFSLAEHLVFALTGAALAVVTALIAALLMLLIRVVTKPRRHQEPQAVAVAIFVLMAIMVAQFVWRGNSWSRDWPPLVAYLVTIAGLGAAYFAWRSPQTRISLLPVIAIFFVYFFGLATGLASRSLGPPDTLLQTGEQVILVRFGQSYSLVSQDGQVVAIATGNIRRIAQK